MTPKAVRHMYRIASLLLVTIFLASCNLANEFTTVSYLRLAQTSRSLADITGKLMPTSEKYYTSAVQLKGFHVGSVPYLAIKVSTSIDKTIYLCDTDLRVVKTIKKSNVPHFQFDNEYWHIDGTADSTTYGVLYLALSNWDMDYSYTASYSILNWNTKTEVYYTYNASDVPYRGPDHFALHDNSGNTAYLDGSFIYTNPGATLSGWPLASTDTFWYTSDGKYSTNTIFPMGNSPVLMDFRIKGTKAIAWVFDTASIHQKTPAAGRPLFYTSTDPLITGSSGGTGFTDSGYQLMDLAFDQDKDADIYPTSQFIMDIRASNEGFIVPYPSNRDRLIDFTTGKHLYTFELTDSDYSNSGSTIPRAYVNGEDFWFLYDRESGMIHKLRGWWL